MSETNSPSVQFSIWQTSENNIKQYEHKIEHDQQQSSLSKSFEKFEYFTNDDTIDHRKQRYRLSMYSKCCCSSMSTFLQGLLLGCLIGGIILAIIISIWLTSTNKTTYATVDTTTVTTISAATVTTHSTTSTTSSTKSTTTTSTASTSTTSITSTASTSSTSTTKLSTTSTTTTSTVSTTTTSTSCSTPTSTVLSYSPGPKNYTLVQYNYSAASSGIGMLEFSFYSRDPTDFWYLDDVSLQDINASNADILVNGNFENGTFAGWQLICNNTCKRAPQGGTIATAICHNGSYCYKDACEESYDFLQQTFTQTIGHIYTLKFWLQSDGVNNQKFSVKFY